VGDAAFASESFIDELAAAETYGWDVRPPPKPRGAGTILTGRGLADAFRGQTVVAEIAEVEVNRETGHVWVKRLVCAHDCGLVVNPEALRHEEVQFNTERVTSVDWISRVLSARLRMRVSFLFV
jgi:nicotinate dehydrogenase subunit B